METKGTIEFRNTVYVIGRVFGAPDGESTVDAYKIQLAEDKGLRKVFVLSGEKTSVEMKGTKQKGGYGLKNPDDRTQLVVLGVNDEVKYATNDGKFLVIRNVADKFTSSLEASVVKEEPITDYEAE